MRARRRRKSRGDAAVSDDRPSDWFRPTTIDGEPAYLVTREGIVFFSVKSDGKVATQAQAEIAQIVAAWWRGKIFPRSAAPTMSKIFDVPAWERATGRQSPSSLLP